MHTPKKKYLLILDTYTHSARDCYYFGDFNTMREARETLTALILDHFITMLPDGPSKNKIYCAFIARRTDNAGNYVDVARTAGNGVFWRRLDPMLKNNTRRIQSVHDEFWITAVMR